MKLDRNQRYAVVIGSSVAIGILSIVVLKGLKANVWWAILPFAVSLVTGIVIVSRQKKENFEADDSGCNQTINITQNCKSGPSPPAPPAALTAASIKKWIVSLNPSLTSDCQNCIIAAALKLWNSKTLTDVVNMAPEKQQSILKALLAFDCTKQCVIPPSGLDETAVEKWLKSLIPNLAEDCSSCVVDAIMKMWSPLEFTRVEAKMRIEQLKIVQAIFALHCETCEPPEKLNSAEVQKWLSGILTGASSECYTCAVNTIVKMWSPAVWAKVKAMDVKSRTQVVQALIDINCMKECVEIPSSLDQGQVQKWLAGVLVGETALCSTCIVATIMKLWTPKLFQSAQAKSKLEQSRIVQGIVALNCKNPCVQNALQKQQVVAWVKQALPKVSAACVECIADKAFSMWTKEDFNDLLSKPTKEQAKLAKMLGDFNCPHVCNIPPLEECDYLPY